MTQLSRHPARPYFLDYVELLFTDFFELAGRPRLRRGPVHRRRLGAAATGETVMLIGHQKGRNTKENMLRNFGMPRPEGYRKARRLMELAERFGKPILTFVDTPGRLPRHRRRGARPGRGHRRQPRGDGRPRPCPVVSTVIGEGGSGGALAIGVANRVLMLENSIYSVISPESCSSILYRDTSKAEKAADALAHRARSAVR